MASIFLSSLALADTVIDVSQEWNAHRSSATLSVNASTKTIESLRVSTNAAVNMCPCESLTVQDKLDQATYAFTGMVLDAEKPKKGKRKIVFDVDEVFKGTPKEEMEVVEEVAGNDCDIPYEVGQTYLVFAQWTWGTVLTARCMGTKLIEKPKEAAVLGPSEAAKEKLYLHLRDACMGRLDTACCLSSLKEMHVGYYVPEPEEGCEDGTVPDRLSCAGSYTWCIPPAAKSHRPAEN